VALTKIRWKIQRMDTNRRNSNATGTKLLEYVTELTEEIKEYINVNKK
jgi:hypothetical protein